MPDSVLVTSVKNECPYLLEFIAHYTLLGFDDLLIVTNDNTDATVPFLGMMKDASFVDFIVHSAPPNVAPQRPAVRLAYDWLREHAWGRYCYVADADEFLMLARDSDIGSYLSRFPALTCVCLNWKFFGSNGHLERPKDIVMAAYPRRAQDDFRENHTLKSIFLLDDRVKGFSAHFPHHREPEGLTYQFADGRPFPASQLLVKPHQDWAIVSYDYAAVNHYGLKSRAEYRLKQARGRGARSARSGLLRHTEEYFAFCDNHDVFDPPPADWLARVRAEMTRMFDKAALGRAFTPEYFGLS